MSIINKTIFPYNDTYNRVLLTYIGEIIQSSERYFHYHVTDINGKNPHSLKKKYPLHSYLIPGTIYQGYYDQSDNVLEASANISNLSSSIEIIGQAVTETISFNEEIYVLKRNNYLLYDILNDCFYETPYLSTLRFWDLFFDTQETNIPSGSYYHKLSNKEQACLKIERIKYYPHKGY